MKSREEYIDKMSKQLKEWSAKIDELESKASMAGDNMKMGYEQRIHELKDKRETVSKKLQELKETTGDAWEAIMVGVENAWGEFKSAFKAAREKFKKAA